MPALVEPTLVRPEAVTHRLSDDVLLSKPPRKRGRLIAIVVGLAVVASGAAIGVPYAVHSMSHESTDDAFIDADVVPVSPKVSGHVVELNVTDNQWVHEGDLLATIDPRDYQVRV